MYITTWWWLIMCQFAEDPGSSNSGSNITLGISVRVFLDEMNMWIGRLSKQIDLSNVGVSCLIRWRFKYNKKDWIKGELLLTDWLTELGHWSILTFLGSESAVHQTGMNIIGYPGLLACPLQISALVSLQNCVSYFLIINLCLPNRHTLLTSILFLCRSLANRNTVL